MHFNRQLLCIQTTSTYQPWQHQHPIPSMNQLQTSNHSFLLFLNTLLAVSPKWHRVKCPRISIAKMKQMETVMMNILTACTSMIQDYIQPYIWPYILQTPVPIVPIDYSLNCVKISEKEALKQCKGEEGTYSCHQKLNSQEGKVPKECGVFFIPLGLWIVDCVYYDKVISRSLKFFV